MFPRYIHQYSRLNCIPLSFYLFTFSIFLNHIISWNQFVWIWNQKNSSKFVGIHSGNTDNSLENYRYEYCYATTWIFTYIMCILQFTLNHRQNTPREFNESPHHIAIQSKLDDVDLWIWSHDRFDSFQSIMQCIAIYWTEKPIW